MSNTAICIIALFCLMAWWELVEAVKAIVASRSRPVSCPCREMPALQVGEDLPGEYVALQPGKVVPLQPGEPAAIETAARKVH